MAVEDGPLRALRPTLSVYCVLGVLPASLDRRIDGLMPKKLHLLRTLAAFATLMCARIFAREMAVILREESLKRGVENSLNAFGEH